MMCAHRDFEAKVAVNRFEDSGRFVADVSVRCSECGLQFRFVGVERVGVDWLHPTVNIDETLLSAPIEPETEKRLRGGASYRMPPETLGD